MGKVDRHLKVELLSALADGELDLSAARNAQQHLADCADCAARLAAFGQLDRVLAAPAPVTCAAALELRSALLDRELSPGEAAVAQAHLASCEACRADQVRWTSLESAVRHLPATVPPAALDTRIARLTAPSARPRFGLTPGGIGALAARGAVAIALVLALLVGLLPGDVPQQAQVPAAEQALVSAVQQAVLYAPTNTLYVVQTEKAAVDAVDANTYALRTRIAVGGRPTALALNEATSRVIVLDPSQRSLVEIDAKQNTVVSTTRIDGIGTPTSVQVDPNSGKVIVAAIPDPPAIGGPAPTPTLEARPVSGVVAVIDTTTKKLETVKSVDVAPRVVVTDAFGKETLLVSAGATTVVDPAYKTLRTLPGGVAAAFGARGVIAVLAADGPGAAVVYFNGDDAPGPLRLPGVPLAVTPVPGIGFAVLLGSGSGNGRIVVVDEAGRGVGTVSAAASARDLAFDPASKKLVIVGAGTVASADLPSGVLAAATPAVESRAPASAIPSPSAPPISSVPQASPSVSPAPSASASPTAVASPIASPQPSAIAAIPSVPEGVPSGAVRTGEGLYRLDLGGRIPVLTAASPTRIWFTDLKNGLSSIDMGTGAVYTFASFPRDAEITALAVGPTSVYAADGKKGRLFTFDIATERLASRPLPFLNGNVVMTVAPDGRLWIGMETSAQLLTYDPITSRTEVVDTQTTGVVAVAIDNFARVWFSDGQRLVGSYDLRTRRVTHVRVPGRGAARALLPDPSGSIWLGTTAGEVVLVTDGSPDVVAMTGRPISRLVLDTQGVAWYLTPAPSGSLGYVYGPARDPSGARVVAAPVASLDFSIRRAAWLADVSGAFYVAVGAAQ